MAIAIAVIIVTLPLGILVGTLWWKNEGEKANRTLSDPDNLVRKSDRKAREKQPILTLSEPRRLTGHTGSVCCVAFTPDGALALSGGWDKTLRVWDVETGEQLRSINTFSSCVPGLTIAPDGERILFGCLGNRAFQGFLLWDMKKDKELARLPGGETWSNDASFSPDGRRAIVNGHGNALQVWDLEKRQVIGRIISKAWIERFAASSNFRQVITCTQWDRIASLWDLETGRFLIGLTGHTDGIQSVAISPDSRLAVTGSKDKTICLWDLESRKLLHTFHGHQDHVTSLTFSPDSKRILSGSSDQTVRVWDVASGGQIAKYFGHEDKVTSIAISPDGLLALSGGSDGTLLMWRLKE
jgi:WD40 repeat protein